MPKMNDSASSGMMILFVLLLFVGLGFYIFIGYGMDMLNEQHASLNSQMGIPVTQERIDAANNINLVFSAIPVFGILLPLIVYAFIVSKRDSNSWVR